MPEKSGGTKKRPKHGGPRKPTPKRAAAARTDWDRVDATTDRDIAEQLRDSPDEVEFTDAMVAEARWVMPEKKIPISFRVDPEVLAFFKRAGAGYQSRMNAVLRSYVRSQRHVGSGGRKSA
jgi:uncharacterized protein (DUF4415 family)